MLTEITIYEMLKKAFESKDNIEEYIFGDKQLMAYFATALAGHNELYKIIRSGSLEQKINAIEHGSSKHIEIMTNDYNPIIKKRAAKKAEILKGSICHEYVTSEKIKMLFDRFTPEIIVNSLMNDANPFVREAWSSIRKDRDVFLGTGLQSLIKREVLHELMADENLIDTINSAIKFTDDEMSDKMAIDLEKSEIAVIFVEEEIKKSKEFLSKYNFTFEIEHSYQLGCIIISRNEEELFIVPVNYSYYNETNPMVFIYVRDIILGGVRDALEVYDASLDKYDFSSVMKFEDHKEKRLLMKKLGFSKNELFKILHEYDNTLREDLEDE